ncbi:MAG: amidohydrolase family protein [Acidobacteriota bacterium]
MRQFKIGNRWVHAGALVLMVLAASSAALSQQAATELTWETAENPGLILVRNATIWTQGPQGILQNSDMLVRDGKIAEIGRSIRPPAGAMVIDGTDMQVTPGLIDAHSHTGADAINEGSHSVTAEVRIGDVLNPSDRSIYRQLAGGLTSAQVLHGSANAIGGQSAIIKLRYKAPRAHDLLFEGATPTIKFALGENPKRSNFRIPGQTQRYPNTRMGVEQTIRKAFLAAQDYKREWQEFNALTEAEQARRVPPRRDLQLEALVEILDGKRFVHSHSYRQDEILMLIRLAEDFGFKIGAFQHVLEGYKVAYEIAEHGAGASTFSDWWAYKLEAYDAIPYNGAIMHDAGIVVSFNSDSSDLARRLNLEAAKAVKYGGLPEQEALAFVTINPAKQLKIDDKVGSLEVGKDADFVVWNGHPLSVYSHPEMTFIDGRKVFDRKIDLQVREAVEAERAALIAKVKGEKKEGEKNDTGEGTNSKKAAEKETESRLASWRDPAPGALEYRPSSLPDAGSIAITGATVHPVSGPAIDNGVVVVANGRITAVGGPGTAIPADAERIDAAGKHLYPGMIATDSVLGLTEIGSVAGGNDQAETGDLNANIRAEVAVNPESAAIPVTRANGITHSLTVPRGGLLMGTSALLRLDGWTWEGLTAVAPVAMHLNYPSFRQRRGFGFFGRQPSGQSAEERRKQQFETIGRTFEEARAYAKAKAAEAEGGPHHADDPVLDAMIPVIEGNVPLIVHTSDVHAVRSAVEWASKKNLRIVLMDSGDAWREANLLAEHDVPVIISSILAMPARADEPYDSAYARAAKLYEAGVKFCIGGSSGGPGGDAANLRNLPYHAGFAAAFGLPKEEALRSVTLYPAQILGVDKDLGSIEVGKSASLVITDGDILEIRTNVLEEWIDGRPVDLSSKHTRLWEKYRSRPHPSR